MQTEKIKIGIVFFDEKHIIPHFIGPVKEMFQDPDIDVQILTYQNPDSFLYKSLQENKLPQNIIKELPTYRYRKLLEKLKSRKIPSPLYLFKKHKNFLLNEYDVLVFNDINHEYLHRYKKNEKPKFVLLMHGAGDREYLIGKKYEESIAKFDLVTTSGQKVTEFFKKMHLPHTKIEICGYQKFDLINLKKPKKFFDNDKPTVLYNPHFSKELSSWYPFGKDILDFFYQQKDYNLIFAPHINLFNKKGFLNPDIIDQKYFKDENILIDLGSDHTVNMDYTLSADIYLGDVSSQIYEFLYTSKPAIFINTHKPNWENNPHYRHWKMGPVIKDLSALKALLDKAPVWHQNFKKKQLDLMSYTFANFKDLTASKKIVQAIKSLTG